MPLRDGGGGYVGLWHMPLREGRVWPYITAPGATCDGGASPYVRAGHGLRLKQEWSEAANNYQLQRTDCSIARRLSNWLPWQHGPSGLDGLLL